MLDHRSINRMHRLIPWIVSDGIVGFSANRFHDAVPSLSWITRILGKSRADTMTMHGRAVGA